MGHSRISIWAVPRYRNQPAATLREWHWRALAKAYAAGDEGLDNQPYGDYGRIGWNTWLRLRDYKWGALIEERPHAQPPMVTDQGLLSRGSAYRVHITAAGRALYEREWSRYREMYPDVEALEPTAMARRQTAGCR